MSIRTSLASSLFCLLASSVQAHDFCEREARIDPELPAGFAGSYRLVGVTPEGHSYAGTLMLGIGDTHYTLAHEADGRTQRGEAWFERCGPDRIRQLAVRIDAHPATAWICHVATDGDNAYRMTCTSPHDGQARQGLEAWFQQL